MKLSDDANQTKRGNGDSPVGGFAENHHREPENQPTPKETRSFPSLPKPNFALRLWRKLSLWYTDPSRPKPHIAEWITVFLTPVLAGAAILQVRVYYQQRKSWNLLHSRPTNSFRSESCIRVIPELVNWNLEATNLSNAGDLS
ncbi:MAG: hypothetical protein WA672_14890, partial [Candidatus Angelobacter sp.]